MNLKLITDEVLISTDDIDEMGKLNSFFLYNHTSEVQKGDVYTAKVMVTKSEGGGHLSISICFD